MKLKVPKTERKRPQDSRVKRILRRVLIIALVVGLMGLAATHLLALITGYDVLAVPEEGVTAVMTPIQSGFSAVVDWVVDYLYTLKLRARIELEYNQLKTENEQLVYDAMLAEELQHKLSVYENLYDEISVNESLNPLVATVIGRESGNYFSVFTINKGSNDGVEDYMAVTMDGDTITAVEVISNSETIEIAGGALEQIPAAIVAANSPDVDVVSGATYTSNGIINAVKNAISGTSPEPEPEATPEPTQAAQTAAEAYQGFGLSNTVRMGPGSDDTGTPVYSINQVFANTLFDSEGRIVAIYVDQLEYATPNYDGAEMPHFSGWPGQGGYNNDSNHDAVVDGTTPDTEEQFTEEVAGWITKRDRGDDYVMGTGTWHEQMDAFQRLFVGMTVDEVEEWFAKYCSDANGRPLKESSSGEGDAEKYAALTDEEKAMLADITSSATMSLNDSHGDILSAIRASFDNMVPVDLTLG